MRIYTISDKYGQMSIEEINDDVARFFAAYIRKNNMEDIEPEDVPDVFMLYIFRYLEYTDKTFDITQN